MSDMVVYLNGTALTNYSDIQELTAANASEIRSLDATLSVDFINYRRGWKITWDLISVIDYDIIKALYTGQFASGGFPHLEIPGWGVSAPVYIRLNESNIKFSGQYIKKFSIELLEQYAIS